MDQPLVLLEQLLQTGWTASLGAAKFAEMLAYLYARIPLLYNIHVAPPWVLG